VGQSQLAHCMTWMDPIDDRWVVQQSVGKLDCSQGVGKYLGHGQGVNCDCGCGCDCDCEHGATVRVNTIALE